MGQRQTPLPSPTRSHSSDRCVTSGMGRPPGRGGDQGPLVSGRIWDPYQLIGASGDPASTESISSCCEREGSAGVHGQHHCNVVLQ
ncbi:hypothetical protein NDU88_008512, partial [Pleurodeles waltl]